MCHKIVNISFHSLVVFIKYFAVYKYLCIESTMKLEQKEKKQMLGYNLDFSLLVPYEYHRRDTRIVGSEFLHES